MRAITLFSLLGLIAVSVLVGCGGGAVSDRQPVQGEITLHGEPLDQGVIQFNPKSGGSGSFAGTEIKEGRYHIPAESGLSPGVYEVRISSGEPGTAATEAMPGESGPPAEERIPAEFSTESTLEYTVSKEGPQEFDIRIP